MSGAVDGVAAPRSIKVHFRLCSDLQNLIESVSKIIPEIEAARPRGLGMEALCQLNECIAKAKCLLQRCSELSVLYLVFTGDATLLRCKRLRTLVEYNLGQIQKMVPVILAAKISGIILVVTSTVFSLDPPEPEFANVLRDLFCRWGVGLTEEFPLSEIHALCSWLQISSPEALATEKSLITGLRESLGKTVSQKREILKFLLILLNKYTNAKNKAEWGKTCAPSSLSGQVETQPKCRHAKAAETDMLSRVVPPEEFLCPLSARLMHDPVIIATGQTYKREDVDPEVFRLGARCLPKDESFSWTSCRSSPTTSS